MPNALASIRLRSVDFSLDNAETPASSIIDRFPTDPQTETNWCWAAVGAGLYNYYLTSSTAITQAAFAQTFGKTQEDEMRNPIEIIDALEAFDIEIPRHDQLRRRDLRDTENLWSKIKASITAQRPVPLAIRWNGNHTVGHMLCILGVSSLGGKRAVIVYDPAEDYEPEDNLREIAFSRSYPAGYRDLSGYISVAFVP